MVAASAPSDLRILVEQRPSAVVVNSFVAPGKLFKATALKGKGEKTKVVASGYGMDEMDARDDLEANAAKPKTRAKRTVKA